MFLVGLFDGFKQSSYGSELILSCRGGRVISEALNLLETLAAFQNYSLWFDRAGYSHDTNEDVRVVCLLYERLPSIQTVVVA